MDLEQTWKSLRATGLTLPESEVPLLTDEPKIPEYLCFPNERAAAKLHTSEISGLGFHPDELLARVKAIAECLERLCLANTNQPLRGPAVCTELSGSVDPATFFAYSSGQFADREQAFREARKARYRWLPVTDHASGAECLIPAQMVFLVRFPDEYQLRRDQLNTGAALGPFGTGRALRSGIFEGVERDASIAAYLKRAPLSRIVDLPEDLVELTAYFRRYRLESHIFDTTSGLGIPSVLVITIDETGLGPAVNVGLRASETYHDAIRSALLESIQARRGARLLELPERFPGKTEVLSLDQRFYFWYPVERIRDLSFWLNTGNRVSYLELAPRTVSLEQTVVRLREKGFHIFVADVTLPEVRERGFEALRIVIPELHPLFLDERAKALYSVHHGEIGDDSSLAPHPIT